MLEPAWLCRRKADDITPAHEPTYTWLQAGSAALELGKALRVHASLHSDSQQRSAFIVHASFKRLPDHIASRGVSRQQCKNCTAVHRTGKSQHTPKRKHMQTVTVSNRDITQSSRIVGSSAADSHPEAQQKDGHWFDPPLIGAASHSRIHRIHLCRCHRLIYIAVNSAVQLKLAEGASLRSIYKLQQLQQLQKRSCNQHIITRNYDV